jgi:hypothetical protein
LDQEDIEDRCSMTGTDLTNVAEKELKDESEDGGAKRRHPELSASLRNTKPHPVRSFSLPSCQHKRDCGQFNQPNGS